MTNKLGTAKEKSLSEKEIPIRNLNNEGYLKTKDVAYHVGRAKKRCTGITHCNGFIKILEEEFGDMNNSQEDGSGAEIIKAKEDTELSSLPLDANTNKEVKKDV